MQLISQYKGLRREMYVLFFGRIVTSLGSMVYPLLTLILSRKLGLNATQVALVTIGSGIFYLPASLIGGKLADRFNRKMIIVWCDLCSIIALYTIACLPLTIYSVMIFLGAGAFQNIEHPAYNALVADLTLSKDRERAYSLTYLGMNIGLVIAPTIAGFLFENHLKLCFLLSGTSIAISTILIFFLLKDITPTKETDEASSYQKSREGESIFSILKENKLLILYAIIMTLYWGAYGQYGYLMPMDMGAIHGDKGAVIYGSVSSINSLTVVLFTPILTKLLSKVVSTKKCILGQLFVLIGYISFLLFRGHIPFYYLAMFLFTLGEILSTFVEGPYLTQRVPASHRGRINGIMSVSQTLLSGVMMLLVGVLYDYLSPATAWTFVMSTVGVSLSLAFILMVLDKKRYPALYQK